MSVKTGERYFPQEKLREIAITTLEQLDNYPLEQVDGELLPLIIKYFFDEGINLEDTINIVGFIKNNDTRLFEQTITDIYQQRITNMGKAGLMLRLSDEEFNTIERLIEPKKWDKVIRCRLSDKQAIYCNGESRQVTVITKFSETRKTKELVLDCCPKEVIVYDTMLLDQPRTFKVTWISHVSERAFITAGETGGGTISEITEYLANAGYVVSQKHAKNTITALINEYIRQDKAIIKREVDNPGFYYNLENDSILPVKKDTSAPEVEDMVATADLLEELAQHFKDNLSSFATVLKWGMLSQFAYAKKQVGNWLPYLYLKGSAGSGKTTLAKLVLYMYGGATTENNLGGSGFDTQARVGAKLSRDCNPIVVNEPAGAFNRPSVVELIKVSVESTTSRGKMINGGYRTIPAFSSVIFTANQYLPEDDALLRRFYTISFSYSLRKSKEEKEAFEKQFGLNNTLNNRLHGLEVLARFTASEIIENPSYLLDDWQDICNLIIRNYYADIDREAPEWLLSWEESEGLEDFDSNQLEDIRIFFNKCFNDAKKKIKVYDADTGYYKSDANLDISNISDSSDFEAVNWEIINNRLIDWCLPHLSRNKTRYVCFTKGVRKAISQEIDFCSDLKSLSELLEWEYKNIRFNGKQTRVMLVDYESFLNFLYPSIATF